MTNVLWLTSDQMGCGSYRCYTPALTLEERGLATNHFLLHLHCKPEAVESYADMQVVVFQRAVGPVFLRWMQDCRARGIRTVFEMDDDLFHVSSHNPAGWHWRQKAVQRMLRAELAVVDHVIVSTRPLAERINQEMGWPAGQKVSVCHNHLHDAVWGDAILGSVMPYPNQTTVIGWQGSTTHDVDFKQALPALKRILDDYPQVILRLFGSLPLSMEGVIAEPRFQWAKGVEFHRYPTTLRFMNFDIGIAPVTDSHFNRGKSNIKWLEYAACGVPCVASAVYPYARSITHGETGYLATTSDEWYAALKTLIDSPALRRRVGQQARAHVWSTWSAEQHAASWVQALALPVEVPCPV